MGKTSIEWTERTWNPVRGCTRVSPGCGGPGPHGGCYAEAMAARFSKPGQSYHGLAEMRGGKPRWTGRLALAEDAFVEPLQRRKPTTWFVNSMSDLFHEGMPDAWIDRVFAVMALRPCHTFQVLTKRSARMRAYMANPKTVERIGRAQRHLDPEVTCYDNVGQDGSWPLPNAWLGVSAEDQRRADERVPDLLATPAAVRFVSAEPLLGPIDFEGLDTFGGGRLDVLRGVWAVAPLLDTPRGTVVITRQPPRLDWIIAGGESGPDARPMHPDWARSLRDQCDAARVPFHFKQWGAWGPGEGTGAHENALLTYVPADGTWGRPERKEARGHAMHRVGKKAAGRLLDGVAHDGMPGGAP